MAREAVNDTFYDYTVSKEGYTPFMYCDKLNLVTTCIGNLVDAGPNHPGASSVERARLNNVVSAAAMAPAMRLPWRKRGPGWTSKRPVAGDLVSPAEVADAWTRVKRENERTPGFAQRGGFAYANLTDLTLTMEDIHNIFYSTLSSFEATLSRSLPGFERWPSDAQFATLSMSWAMGPNFTAKYPRFTAAAIAENFDVAAQESYFDGGGLLTDPTSRNAHNLTMFTAAASVVKGGGDRNRLYFPGTSGAPTKVSVPNPAEVAQRKTFNPGIGNIALGTVAVTSLGYAAFEWFTKKGK